MSKAPQPSPWGLISVVALFGFLIWHGPWDERWGSSVDLVLPTIEVEGVYCDRDTLTEVQQDLCDQIKLRT